MRVAVVVKPADLGFRYNVPVPSGGWFGTNHRDSVPTFVEALYGPAASAAFVSEDLS